MGLERMSSNIDQRDYPVYSVTDNINSTFIPQIFWRQSEYQDRATKRLDVNLF